MPYALKVISGHVYVNGDTTAISGAIITAKLNTGEQHNGSEALFPELITNSKAVKV